MHILIVSREIECLLWVNVYFGSLWLVCTNSAGLNMWMVLEDILFSSSLS
jgi:hypothetical protein